MPDMRFIQYLVFPLIAFCAVCCTTDSLSPDLTMNDRFYGNYGSGVKFADKSFYDFCLKNYDSDGDGVLSDKEMASVSVIDCSGQGLKDMAGLGNFTNLDTLRCSHNNLKELDLSRNRKLRFLDCSNNFLEKLDVSPTNISTLYCYPMTDAAGNNLLLYLFIYRGQTIDGITNGRDSSKGRRIPEQTTIISVPESKDGDTDIQNDRP